MVFVLLSWKSTTLMSIALTQLQFYNFYFSSPFGCIWKRVYKQTTHFQNTPAWSNLSTAYVTCINIITSSCPGCKIMCTYKLACNTQMDRYTRRACSETMQPEHDGKKSDRKFKCSTWVTVQTVVPDCNFLLSSVEVDLRLPMILTKVYVLTHFWCVTNAYILLLMSRKQA